jgi:hypothetical protein
LRSDNKSNGNGGIIEKKDQWLLLHTPIVALSTNGVPVTTSKVEYLDAPGANEACNDKVGEMAQLSINSADVLIYVVNFTMMGQTGEQKVCKG